MHKSLKSLLVIASFSLTLISYSQNSPQGVSISNEQTPPSQNAILDVVSENKGMLVPRVAYSEILTGSLAPSNIIAGEDGLLVFVTDFGDNYGYWFFNSDSNAWERLGSEGEEFSIPKVTWSEMFDISQPTLGQLVFVTDCLNSCIPPGQVGSATVVKGLYSYEGTYIVDGGNSQSFPKWVRLRDGFFGSKCSGALFAGGICNTVSSSSFIIEDVLVTPKLSDSTMKDNVVVISNAMDKLESIRGVYFDWNTAGYPEEQQIGLIAQEVESVFPQAVGYVNTGKLGVKYELLIAPLIEATKEQQTVIDTQATKISTLESQLAAMLARLEALESN